MIRHLSVLGLLLLALVTSIDVGQASPSQQSQPQPIRLKAATFVPARGEAPSIPPGLAIAGYAQDQRGYYIVQFAGPVEQAWKDQVTALGTELLDYIPEFAFKVRMTPGQAQRVERLKGVVWVGLFHPAYKLSPGLPRDGMRLYTVRIERGADVGQTRSAIVRTGATASQPSGSIVTIGADPAQLEAIAQVPDVAWIEEYRVWDKHNEYAAGVIMGANVAGASGYDGSTQTVGVADTGLGGGTTTTAHPDIAPDRIKAIYNRPGAADGLCFASVTDDGARDVSSGHGTHVAGSVLGDGGPLGEGKGTAPGANLVFQAVENWANTSFLCQFLYGLYPGYYLTGIPSDLGQLFQQAYDVGARIHSDSWGAATAGDYDTYSVGADSFLWSHRDMAITFSAGNSGVDANGDGVVDNDSLDSPATAKNVISVGASENDRQTHWEYDTGLPYASGSGQNDLYTYGSAWPGSYPAEPLYSDPTGGNAEQMAAFSSRGPTDDGRIKPDVVAPGTWVLSSYSDLYQQGYDGSPNPQDNNWQYDGWGYPLSQYYKYMGGTSMSNPLTAGGAAVVRDYYQKALGHEASAALVKATLINSAVDLLDENNDGVPDNRFPIPNVHEGWGRVNLAAATDGTRLFLDQTGGIATGNAPAYGYTVAGGASFKVTLVWTDYPSTEAATENLVNDLDLEVSSPDGTLYRGNVFDGGWAIAGGSPDRINNVENVYLPSAQSGTWTVTVRGANVPNGPQPFALVVEGASSMTELPTAIPLPTGTATASPSPSPTWEPGTVNLALQSNGGQVVAFSSEYNYPLDQRWLATHLNDGRMDLGWSTDTYYTSNQWIIVKLSNGDSYDIGRIRLNPSATSGDGPENNIRDFQIRVSNTDAEISNSNPQLGSFTTVLTGTAPQTNTLLEYTFPTVGARYVMLFGVNNYGGQYLESAELEVYQPSPAAITSTPTGTATSTATATGTATATLEPSATSTGTATPTSTTVLTDTPTPTATPTATLVPSLTPTQTSTATPTATATATSAPTTIHVGDLDGAGRSVRNNWYASVTVTVHDANHAPVSGATVSGIWSGGYSGSASCFAGGSGQCTVTSGTVPRKVGSITFTVDNVAHPELTFEPADFHDPDGDAVANSITISKP